MYKIKPESQKVKSVVYFTPEHVCISQYERDVFQKINTSKEILKVNYKL